MTPEERAEKIQKHCLGHGGICSGPEVLAIIAAEIRAAVEEAQTVMAEDSAGHVRLANQQGRELGRHEAYEDAAVIAQRESDEIGEVIADLIRTRAKEM